jgi:hypothetical protein
MVRPVEDRNVYKPDLHPQKAETLAEQGLIDIEIARGLGISRTVYYEWKKRFPEFSDTVRRGKEKPDAEMAHSFRRTCHGYDYEESKVTIVVDGSGKAVGKKIVIRTKKHRPGSVAGQIFWLRVRQPQEWDPVFSAPGGGVDRVPALDRLPEHLLREIAEGRGVYHKGGVIPIAEFERLPPDDERDEDTDGEDADGEEARGTPDAKGAA